MSDDKIKDHQGYPVTGDARSHDDMRRELRLLCLPLTGTSVQNRLSGIVAESILLLVEAVDRLTNSHDEHAGKTAAAIDYISDHLNEIGEKS